MPNVVRGESHFDPINAQGSFWEQGDSSVVYKYIDGGDIGPRQELCCCSAYRMLTGKVDVQAAIVNAGKLGSESIDALLKLRQRSAGDNKMCGSLRGLYTYQY